MKRSAVKLALFTLTNVIIASAHADDLMMIEELPIEQRLIAHQQVIQFLAKNPEYAEAAKYIAIDQGGTVYVLDKNKANPRDAGNPSCYSSRISE